MWNGRLIQNVKLGLKRESSPLQITECLVFDLVFQIHVQQNGGQNICERGLQCESYFIQLNALFA